MKLTVTWENGKPVYSLDGKRVSQRKVRKMFQPVSNGTATGLIGFRPLASEALAVHPDDIPAAMERDRKHGIYCNYDAEGRPILTSRQERARMIRSLNLFDRDAGYGDPAPEGRFPEAPLDLHPEI